jgi:hypothetical protein
MPARDPALDTAGRRLGAFLDRTIKEFRTPTVELPKSDDFKPMHAEPERLKIGTPLGEFKELTGQAEPIGSKPAPKSSLNKFTELAAKLKANREEMHTEADKLSAETDAVMATFRDGVAKHRSILEDAKSGVQDLKDAANIMSNFDPNED